VEKYVADQWPDIAPNLQEAFSDLIGLIAGVP
jgi:hypothetical protein